MVRRTVLLTVISLCLVVYSAVIPPGRTVPLTSGLQVLSSVEPEMLVYGERFAATFFLLGVIPFIAARLCGYRISDMGIRWQRSHGKYYLGSLAFGAIAGVTGSFSKGIADFYPYLPNIGGLYDRAGPLALHFTAYFLLFYIPWEILFRGLLIFPFLPEEESGTGKKNTAVFSIAMLQTVPSAMLHFGHPLQETLMAVFFGLLAGLLCLRFRSIVPALCVHAMTGIGIDIMLILRGV